jgi:hypothetical protein
VLAPTVIVIVEEPPEVTEPGLKPTLAPVGCPLAVSVTVCAEPVVVAVEIVEVPLAPWATLTLDGLAPMEKSDGAVVTVSATVVECVAVAPVAVTVIVYGPGTVPAPTLMVIVDEPPVFTDPGLKLTVVPGGCPLELSVTVCAEPLVIAVETVIVPEPSCTTLTLEGADEIEKSDGGAVVQPGSVNEPMRVCQRVPVVVKYSFVYQNVQSSTGSTLMLE